jgi:hypothetical protein
MDALAGTPSDLASAPPAAPPSGPGSTDFTFMTFVPLACQLVMPWLTSAAGTAMYPTGR